MTKPTDREVVRTVYQGRKPPYVPWDMGFTIPAHQKLVEFYGTENLDSVLQNHILHLGSDIGHFEDMGNNRFRDIFGVTWDRSIDKDIGVVEGCVLPEPTLGGYSLPDPCQEHFFSNINRSIENRPDKFRVYSVGFSLFERAWTLRGMPNLMMDFIENPAFAHKLLTVIADWNIEHVREAMKSEIDAVHFGDDWGQQRGLLMGPFYWREYIRPQLERMYGAVHQSGLYVSIHSCGDVDELFDDLIDIGLNCFNPFQPEVMNVTELVPKYRGRLAFHGGMSIQSILPYGSVDEVRAEARRLIALGSEGGYIFGPSHAVPGDVPVENLVAMIDEAINYQA